MHEISIAQDLLDLAVEQAELAGCAGRVAAVHVRLGVLAGVVPEALRSAWAAATREGTPLRRARLVIELVPAEIWCGRCVARRVIGQSGVRQCPACGAPACKLLTGVEMELSTLEVEPV